MLDWTGQKLGNYQIMRTLGHGGFANVYLGQHLYLKTYAAIKVLQARLAHNDLLTFLQEAQTIVSLAHPHIVRVLEFGEEGHTPYLIMDYCPNGTLRQRHPKGASVSLPECVAYIKQIAEALQYAHDRKIVHRDVKPENILIGQNDTLLLSDFGIATISQSSRYQSQQDIGGTIAYSAPEQLQGKANAASDQYALGIVLYEWLTGALPYQGTFPEIASQHLVAPVPTLCDKVPSIPHAVELVMQKALAKNPQQRFLNVWAFATTLEQAMEDEPASTEIQIGQTDSQANISTYLKNQSALPTEQLPTSTTSTTRQTPLLSTSSFHAPPYQSVQASPRKGKSSVYIAIIVALVLALLGVSIHTFLGTSTGNAQKGNIPAPRETAQTTLNGQTNPSQTSAPTATPNTIVIVPTATATPSTITIIKNLQLTCIENCTYNDLQVKLTTIVIASSNSKMAWNFTILNNGTIDQYHIGGGPCDAMQAALSLEDPAGNSTNAGQPGTFTEPNPINEKQTLQEYATFPFLPQHGVTYTLHLMLGCKSYDLNTPSALTFQSETFTF